VAGELEDSYLAFNLRCPWLYAIPENMRFRRNRPRKTNSAYRLHELGKVDFTGNKPGGPLFFGLG